VSVATHDGRRTKLSARSPTLDLWEKLCIFAAIFLCGLKNLCFDCRVADEVTQGKSSSAWVIISTIYSIARYASI
jgi:hypothetical protein